MTNAMLKMPALFVGHGSPMNAIEDNEYTRNWVKIASEIPKPEAILAVSAHWYTNGSRITDEAHPKMVYDMYGFPDELYRVVYQQRVRLNWPI
jgi:4,5-DOPA dioxygenase extradiol